MYEIKIGDVLEKLREIDDEVVDTVVTSPPYYGLRDYGTGKWTGGNEDCEHEGSNVLGNNRNFVDLEGRGSNNPAISNGTCVKCGAVKEDKQIGLEETPEEFINRLVEVFREVRRVLKPSGTLWVNIGDSYAGSGVDEMKPKDLIGIPWMLAFALRADGWYLRQDIIWSKSNPMPESVKDRCTKAHEYIFLLTKSNKYYYDHEAIKEEAHTTDTSNRDRDNTKLNNTPGRTKMGGLKTNHYTTKNKRSVWDSEDSKYGSIENEANHRQGMHRERGENLVAHRPLLPKQKEFVDFIRQTPKSKLIEKSNIKASTIEHWYRYDDSGFSYPSVEDWNAVSSLLEGNDVAEIDRLMTYIEWKYDDIKTSDTKNKRSVWDVSCKPFKGAHFAVFPPELIEPCVLTSPKKVCADCGVGYVRQTSVDRILSKEEVQQIREKIEVGVGKEKKPYAIIEKEFRNAVIEFRNLPPHDILREYLQKYRKEMGMTIAEIEEHFGNQAGHHWFEKNGSYPSVEDWLELKTLLNLSDMYDQQMTEVFYKSGLKGDNTYTSHGFAKSCTCDTDETQPAVVLDPFAGSGTTGGVAERHGRNSILIELNPEFASLIPQRIIDIQTTDSNPKVKPIKRTAEPKSYW
ncbi:MAG: site-specific DNA-methyltransferase [Candidatus Poseidoniales archaeon]